MIRKVFLTILCGILYSFSTICYSGDHIIIDENILLIPLKDSVYIHVTWHESENFGRFPSNGMIIVKNGKAVMIDTPMDNEKTERLTNFLNDSLQIEVTKFIAGHFHADCIGGLEYLQGKNIVSIAGSLTIEKCREKALPVPSVSFTDSLVFDFHGEKIICKYFGAGHTIDNIIVWLPDKKILFGGCLIRSANAKKLGNLADAVVNEWNITVKKIIEEYRDIEIVVPGHGEYGGTELLEHTIELVKQER